MEETTETTQVEKKSGSGRKTVALVIIGVIALLVIGGLSGYAEGVMERVNAENTQVSEQLSEQFALVEEDIAGGRYDNAKQRLEFIISKNSGFPGATDKLAYVLVQQAITPTPLPTLTPTITPTPDLRDQEAVFANAQQQLGAKDWTGLMGSLDTLRKKDPTYKAATIDAWYYTALRNRGIDQILGTGVYTTTNMEGGIYDLTLAERFGPLDGYSAGLRTFSRMFLTAAAYWDVNWLAAVDNFRQVAANTPNLRDSSNVTAVQRLYQALLRYGDELAASPDKRTRCSAYEIWREARNMQDLDGEYSQKLKTLKEECYPATRTPEPDAFPTDVPPVDPPVDVTPP